MTEPRGRPKGSGVLPPEIKRLTKSVVMSGDAWAWIDRHEGTRGEIIEKLIGFYRQAHDEKKEGK